MVITSGSVVVIGVMTTSTEKASDRIPKSIKAWRTYHVAFHLLRMSRLHDVICR